MSTASALSPPPPVSRTRASSTTVRSPFTLSTLGRRRSTTCLFAADDAQLLEPVPASPSPAQDFQIHVPTDGLAPAANPDHPPASMLVLFASRFLQWFHLPAKHVADWSVPSSPRSSSDDFVLPVSATTQESFVIPDPEKPASERIHWTAALSVYSPILFVIISLPVSTAVVLYSLSTLPINMSWPRTLSDLAQLGRDLHGYSQSGPWPLAHVIAVMALSAVWKHAWSIPGSVLWNVLAGALFSPAFATIMLTALTTIGSVCATLLSTPLAPFLAYMFPRALELTRNALGGDAISKPGDDDSLPSKSSPWVRLSILRLIGVVPWSGINIACGVCGVSLTDCMLGTFIGCLPWTAVTCQIGDILQTVASTPSPTPQTVSSLLTSPDIVFKLIFLSFLSLAPILGRDHLRAMIAPAAASSAESLSLSDDRNPRRSWVQQWRTKIRISSRSRTREQAHNQTELEFLVQEKRRLEDLPS